MCTGILAKPCSTTVELEIFVTKFCVLIFGVKIFRGLGYPQKIFLTTHAKKMWNTNSLLSS